MKNNNYFRLKIYFFIFLIANISGWLIEKTETIMYYDGNEIRKQVFNYASFGLVILIGFAITLLYDVFVLNKSDRSDISPK